MGLVTRRSDKLDDLFNKFASDPLKPVKKTGRPTKGRQRRRR
ncbi:SPJ_0845 family protein [Limosilactobacillus fermentum]|nr:SPJ_0845 family protein [Limosilactobacillus fermentum]